MTTCDKCKYLEKRINSQSRRIHKLQIKFANYVTNHQDYVRKRLPDVIKREKIKADYLHNAMVSMGYLKKTLRQIRFTPHLLGRKDGIKLYPIFLTHSDRIKLQKFLDYNFNMYKIIKRK